ncbi:aminoglycoside phosphotransferase family protein [Shewanella cyperi]|uniref:aminoglycoside phosphotransferase family protein n=1 Tax=Shewanella cyperi TaxID=2814292 RepID=UPI001A9435B2|nr:aminoglycoside phosphotransferase family protein [Shewanella cyperi]QSX39417.1 aminoglycoside phosphotransferase family protein [Shewanella cyperi]
MYQLSATLGAWVEAQIGAPITETRINDSGWSNLVIEINRAWVLRLPKALSDRHSETPWLAESALELGILQALGPRLAGVALPQPLANSLAMPVAPDKASAPSPQPGLLYPRLPGMGMSPAQLTDDNLELARDLGRVLAAIHGTRPQFQGLEAYPYGDGDFWTSLWPMAIRQLSQEALKLAEHYFRDAHERGLDGRQLKPVLCHGDFGPANLLLKEACSQSPPRLGAVLDFSDCCLQDPALDFAPLLRRAGKVFGQQLLASYRQHLGETAWQALEPASLFDRCEFQARRKALFVLWYGDKYGFHSQGSQDFFRSSFSRG